MILARPGEHTVESGGFREVAFGVSYPRIEMGLTTEVKESSPRAGRASQKPKGKSESARPTTIPLVPAVTKPHAARNLAPARHSEGSEESRPVAATNEIPRRQTPRNDVSAASVLIPSGS